MLDLTCDNYKECGGLILARDTQTVTESLARAQGWRVWRGNGLDLVLCPKCVGYRVRRDPVPDRLEGEEPLF